MTSRIAYPILGIVTLADLSNDVEALRLDLLAGAERVQDWMSEHPLIAAAAVCLLMLGMLLMLDSLRRTQKERVVRRDLDRERFVEQIKAETKPRPEEAVTEKRARPSVVATMATLRDVEEAAPITEPSPVTTVSAAAGAGSS